MPPKASKGPAEPPAKKIKLARSAVDLRTMKVRRGPRVNDLKLPLPTPAAHLRPARQVFVWGDGDMGQFGLGPATLGEIGIPRRHKWFNEASEEGKLGDGEAGVEAICVGGLHTLCIQEAGKILSWGVNDGGALGRQTSNVLEANSGSIIPSGELEMVPTVIQALVDAGYRAIKIAASDSSSVAIGELGDLRVWGSFRTSDGALGFPGSEDPEHVQIHPTSVPGLESSEFVSVACGNDHVLALSRIGEVWTFGDGLQGQLGRRINERRKAAGLIPEVLGLSRVVSIGAGAYHSFAITDDGRVYAWGLNTFHQLGIKTTAKGHQDVVIRPKEIITLAPTALDGRRVVSISGGEHHSLFLLDDGSVWGCGRMDSYQLGLPLDHPAMANIVAARTTKGNGNKPLSEEYIPIPVPLLFPPPPTLENLLPPVPPYADVPDPYQHPSLDPIVSISAGTRHNLAVSRSGNIYSWGYGNQCQLGLTAETEFAVVPTRVRSKQLNGYLVKDASAGGQHCFCVATMPA